MLVVLLIQSPPSDASRYNRHDHWVALYPSDFVVFKGRSERWTIDVYGGPGADAEQLGTVRVAFERDPDAWFDVSTRYVDTDGRVVLDDVMPHLWGNDDAYHHLTVLDSESGRVKVQLSGGIEPVWADFDGAFGDAVHYVSLSQGEILRYGDRDIVIEYIDDDGLIYREEQEADTAECVGVATRYLPYTTRRLAKSDWIDADGVSRLHIKYKKGC